MSDKESLASALAFSLTAMYVELVQQLIAENGLDKAKLDARLDKAMRMLEREGELNAAKYISLVRNAMGEKNG